MLATRMGDTGLDGLARVLEGFGLGRGVLWVGSGAVMAVGSLQRAGEEERGGSRVLSPLLLPFSRLGSGQRGLGSTAASSRNMATATRRTATVIFTVNVICSDLCLPSVRRNARKNFKFEILKFFTLGDQHIGQGFQSYFCYKEMLSFAEILFQNLGIVTVSDSKFG
jgi:hypothetical protein